MTATYALTTRTPSRTSYTTSLDSTPPSSGPSMGTGLPGCGKGLGCCRTFTEAGVEFDRATATISGTTGRLETSH